MSAQTGCLRLVQHPSVSRRLSEVLLFASSCNFVVQDCITALWTSFFHSSLDGVSSSRVPTDGKLYFSVRSLIRPAPATRGIILHSQLPDHKVSHEQCRRARVVHCQNIPQHGQGSDVDECFNWWDPN